MALQFTDLKTGETTFAKKEKDLNLQITEAREALANLENWSADTGGTLSMATGKIELVFSSVTELYTDLVKNSEKLSKTNTQLEAAQKLIRDGTLNFKTLLLANGELSDQLEKSNGQLENAQKQLTEAQKQVRFTGDAVLELYGLISELMG